MRRSFAYLKEYLSWFLVILLVEGFCALLLWLADIRLFWSLFPLLLLFSAFVFFVLTFLFYRQQKKREHALINFLSEPGREAEMSLLSAWSSWNGEMLQRLIDFVYGREAEIEGVKQRLSDYETYVETWAHEVKLPLSLLTLILDNQKESIDPVLAYKLDYIRNQVQHQISQILFYYRLRSEKNDFFLENFRLDEAVSEVLEDYGPLLTEKNFHVSLGNLNAEIHSDRRSFDFMLGQVIGNAIKYSGKEERLEISFTESEERKILTVKDGGIGVKACDLPHIFDKGFTGDTGKIRKRSSGMGLYLVKELAQALNIEIEVETVWGEGFAISFIYKKTKSEPGSLES